MDADLARALVALSGWEWRAGMRDTAGRIVLRVRGGRPVVRSALGEPDGLSDWDDDLPDLDDDATGGVLLGMLREVWVTDPDHWIAICADAGDDGPPMTVGCFGPTTSGSCRRLHVGGGPTLARACAAALVAVGRCA